MNLSTSQTSVNDPSAGLSQKPADGIGPLDNPLMRWRKHFADEKYNSTEFQTLTTEGDQLAQIIAKAFPNTTQDTWTHDDLQKAVHQSQTEWQTKERIGKGKPQKIFHTCLGKLDAHSELFKFIPSGDKYFTLITGAVTTLVKASVSHLKTIEALSNAIDTINDAAASCSVESELIHSQAMQNAIAKFYIAVFLFYGDAILWYKSSSKKKILNSLHNDFSEKFSLSLETIRNLSMNVKRIAQLGTAAEVRVVRLELEDLQIELHDVRAGLTGQLRMLAQLSHQQHHENIEHHRRTQALLADYANSPQFSSNLDASRIPNALPYYRAAIQDPENLDAGLFIGHMKQTPGDMELVTNTINKPGTPKDQQPGLLDRTSILKALDFLPNDATNIEDMMKKSYGPLTTMQHNLHPVELALVANDWITSQKPSMLYLASTDQTSKLAFAKMSLHIKSLLETARKPIVVCHPLTLSESKRDDTLGNLVLDLISQLIKTLPPENSNSTAWLQNLSSSTTIRKDPSIKDATTWKEVTELLTETLNLVPDNQHILLHCSDKIATLERTRLIDIVSIFQNATATKTGNRNKIFKMIVFSQKLVGLAPPLRQDQIKFFPSLSRPQMRILDKLPG